MVAPNPREPECVNKATYLPLSIFNTSSRSANSMIPNSTKWFPPPELPNCVHALSFKFRNNSFSLNNLFSKISWSDLYCPRKRSEEHTSELQSRPHLVCRLLLEKKKKKKFRNHIYNI